LDKSDAEKHNLNSFLKEIEEIIKYCNDIFKDISFTYGTIQYEFNNLFNFICVKKEKKEKKNNTSANDEDSEKKNAASVDDEDSEDDEDIHIKNLAKAADAFKVKF
jgi:hypothetical protein